jgi:glycosyltransferase involved in cell wall biosynthesis
MHILHFIASQGMGRGEIYIDLVNTLVHDMKITLLVPAGVHYKERVANTIEVVEYHAQNSRNNPLLYLELFQKIKKIEPDVVHTHFAKASEIFYRLNFWFHLPHVATKHNPRKGKIFQRLPHVIAVSKGVKESIESQNVAVIYNGVTPIEVKPKQPNSVFTLLAVGRLDKIKGYDRLIKACEKLSFNFSLEIVGEGEEREALESLIASCKLEEKVKLLGFQTDIPQRMKNADVVVMSSLSEGFSVVMVESLFYANLFLSTRVSGATEILEEKFFLDEQRMHEKLEEVYRHYEEYVIAYEELKKRESPHLLLSHIAHTHVEYYQNLLGEKE